MIATKLLKFTEHTNKLTATTNLLMMLSPQDLTQKKYLQNLYDNNKSGGTYLEFKGIDIYGRALGILYFDTLNVNENLKNSGGCMSYHYK